ncbi:hypothetical protein GCM10027093_18330 [Paraburkholderia jirisanensis]
MDHLPIPFPSIDFRITLTEQEYSRLQTFNSEVIEAEQWITQHSKDMMLSYSLAAAQERHAENGRLDEDVELTATLFFLANDDQPDVPNTDDRVIAQISIPILSKLRLDGRTSSANLCTDVNDAHRDTMESIPSGVVRPCSCNVTRRSS